MINFEKQLKNLRKERNLSQKELALKHGMSSQTISNIEKQGAFPTFANLERIAQFFNATPTDLFGSSREIVLEKSIAKSSSYVDQADKMMKAVSEFERFVNQFENKNQVANLLLKATVVQNKAVGCRLRQIKDELGLSSTELGELVGINKLTISSYVLGNNPLPLDIARKISFYSGKSVAWLYFGE